MKFLKYLLFLFLIFTIGFAIYIAIQPNEFEISKTRTIKAPASVIYKNVIDFKNWKDWWSIDEADFNTDREIKLSEQTEGIGSSFSLQNNVGVKQIETIEVQENKSIQQKIEFTDKPTSNIIWTFKNNDDGTTDVTWTVSSKNLPFEFKALSIFKGSIEKQMFPNVAQSLEKLDRNIVESMVVYSVNIYGITEYGGGFYMYKTTTATATSLRENTKKQFSSIESYMAQKSIFANGKPFTIYNEMNTDNGNVIMSQAIPIKDKINLDIETNIVAVYDENKISCGYIPKTKALKVILRGNRRNLPEAWSTARAYITNNNLEQSDLKPFEIYTNDSNDLPNPADWITEIYIPIN